MQTSTYKSIFVKNNLSVSQSLTLNKINKVKHYIR